MAKHIKGAENFHNLQPDYERPVLKIPEKDKKKLLDKMISLYGKERGEKYYPELERILKVYYAHKSPEMLKQEKDFEPEERFTEDDVILITYGDLIVSKKNKPLRVMANLCKRYLEGVFNTLHILPFFPYSSDRGFAVMDFEEVDPNLGNWDDILELKKDSQLMFDGVFNHISSKSRWFQEFLNQNPDYQDFFTVFSTQGEISKEHLQLIVRPRTSDVMSPFCTLNGEKLVWTTFSTDQIDLNYKNPKVLLKMIEILLTYIRRGADILRLDAVTYLWEQLGTSCVHLDETHLTIKLFRDVLDIVAPHVALITETNVPHDENIRYFGKGDDETQMVYNFALPPLVLFSFQNGNASKLTEWASTITKISETATYFNFLDSHDGVGVMAVKNILTTKEIENMALKVLEYGGYISYKKEGDGTLSPYELNTTWFSAINREDDDEPLELQIQRYVASRSIALAFMGVPGVYLHGLLGSKNDAEAVLMEKSRRSINRRNISEEELIKELEDQKSSTFRIAFGLIVLIQIRKMERAFHPNSPQKVINLSDSLLCLMRATPDSKEIILAITNITNEEQSVIINNEEIGTTIHTWRDLVSNTSHSSNNGEITLEFEPYQVIWLKGINR